MARVGIWERREGFFEAVEERRAALDLPRPKYVRGEHPADFGEEGLDLLCVSPAAVGWAGAGYIHARTVLLCGAAAPLARHLHAASAVSYGPSARDTLTISSLEGSQLCAALQRELVTVQGRVVERQELVLPFDPTSSPLLKLAQVGALLLLGAAPEQLMM